MGAMKGPREERESTILDSAIDKEVDGAGANKQDEEPFIRQNKK